MFSAVKSSKIVCNDEIYNQEVYQVSRLTSKIEKLFSAI